MEHPKYDHNKVDALPVYYGDGQDTEFSSLNESANPVGGFESPHASGKLVLVQNTESSVDNDVNSELQEKLSPRQYEYYRMVDFLTDQPDFTFTKENAGPEFMKVFGYSAKQWDDLYRKIVYKYKILEHIKESGNSRRSVAVALNVEKLIEYAASPRHPFITDEILERVRTHMEADSLNQEETQSKIERINRALDDRQAKREITPEMKKEIKRQRQLEAAKRYQYKKKRNKNASSAKSNKPKNSGSNKKKTPKRGDFMVFNFIEAGDHFHYGVESKAYTEKIDPGIKLLLAIGQSATFAANRQHQDYYLNLMLNKGIAEPDQLSIRRIKRLIENSKESEELIVSDDLILRLTIGAMAKLRQFKFEITSTRSQRGKNNSDELIVEESNEDGQSTADEADAQDATTESSKELGIDDVELSPELATETLALLLDDARKDLILDGGTDLGETHWMFGENNLELVFKRIAADTGLTEDILAKRLRMFNRIGFIEQKKIKGKIVNVGITSKGAEFWKTNKAEQEIQEDQEVDPEKIELLDSMLQTCLELADALGNEDFIEDFIRPRYTDSFTIEVEKNEEFLNLQIAEAEVQLNVLRSEYAKLHKSGSLTKAA